VADRTSEVGLSWGLVLRIGLVVFLGTPLVAFAWETLNRLLAGILEPVHLLLLVPVGFLLYLLLRYTSRAVQSWDGASDRRPGGSRR